MRKITAAALLSFFVFCAGVRTALAQDQLLLSARPLPVIAALLSDSQPSGRLSQLADEPKKVYKPKNKESKKEEILFTIDIPLSPVRTVADMDGIGSQPFGGNIKPKEGNIGFQYSFLPELNFFSKNAHTSFGANAFVLHDRDKTRENFQIDGLTEYSIWMVLIGARGFGFQETTPFVLWGENYRLDFKRRSYGADAWLGVKLGGFHRSFVAVRFGKGLVEAKGEEKYVSSVLSRPVAVSLYSPRFKVDHQSVEARLMVWSIAPSVRAEFNKYKQFGKPSGRFGLTEMLFSDSKVDLRMELIPSVRKNPLRIVVQRTEYFGSWNKLTFRNDQPEWQVYLRLAFN